MVALKCDLREEPDEKTDNTAVREGAESRPATVTCTYDEGLAVAKRIGALRYLGMQPLTKMKCSPADGTIECSAMRNRGVNEAFSEASRVALSVKPAGAPEKDKCVIL